MSDETSISISVCDQQDHLRPDLDTISTLVKAIVTEAGYRQAQISVVIVDDPAIHEINRRYLEHDHPTDVISFCLEDDGSQLEGEIIVSSETAICQAEEYGTEAGTELLLYVAHGTLHLVGFDDTIPESRRQMRRAEREHLQRLGITLPHSHETT